MTLDFRSDLFQHAQRLSLAFHDQRRSGMLIYTINSQAGAAAELVMSVPPMAQNVITLVGMFWMSYRLNPKLALLSLIVVPFLYYSVGYYVTAHPAAAACSQGDGGRVAVDHPRGDLDAAGDRRVRPRGPRVRALPRAGPASGGRAGQGHGAADAVLAGRQHDHRRRDRAGAGLRRLPRAAGNS